MKKGRQNGKNIPWVFVFCENIGKEVNSDISRNISRMKVYI